MTKISTLVIGATIFTGFYNSALASDQRQTIIFDRWWNGDYAVNACHLAHASANVAYGNSEYCKAAEASIRSGVASIERSLATELASNANCKNVRLIGFADPLTNKNESTTEAVKKSSWWQLMLNIADVNEKEHSWDMQYRDTSGTKYFEDFSMFQGQGDVLSIVKRICTIVNKKGADSSEIQ